MNKSIPHSLAEPHSADAGSRLNWLRAAVLGANDGIVSVAGLVVGVAGATESRAVIFTAGLAGLIAGALSMAAGEYVSVSSQRDTERVLLAKERVELQSAPDQELAELAALYEARGLTPSTARLVAQELTAKDAFAAHVDAELGLDPDNLTNPWHAAFASAAAFLAGALIPLLAILIPPAAARVPVAVIAVLVIAVLVALSLTGMLSAKVGGAPILRATARVVIGGALAMAITYAVGKLFGVSGI
jgi:VIT1/CCC1 family predicted Fe2+/Mn2+ transporter